MKSSGSESTQTLMHRFPDPGAGSYPGLSTPPITQHGRRAQKIFILRSSSTSITWFPRELFRKSDQVLAWFARETLSRFIGSCTISSPVKSTLRLHQFLYFGDKQKFPAAQSLVIFPDFSSWYSSSTLIDQIASLLVLPDRIASTARFAVNIE